MSHINDPLLSATLNGLQMIHQATSDAICKPDATRKHPRTVQDLDSGFALSAPEQLSQDKIDAYLKNGGVLCPECQSSDITGAQFDVIEGAAYQNISCNECGAEWTDEYELTTVTGFRFGVKSTTGGKTIES